MIYWLAICCVAASRIKETEKNHSKKKKKEINKRNIKNKKKRNYIARGKGGLLLVA